MRRIDKCIELVILAAVLATVLLGMHTIRKINDGRVKTVVNQMKGVSK